MSANSEEKYSSHPAYLSLPDEQCFRPTLCNKLTKITNVQFEFKLSPLKYNCEAPAIKDEHVSH